MKPTIRTGPITIRDRIGPGGTGLFFKPRGLTGLSSRPEIRRESLDHPEHGEFDVPGKLVGRHIGIEANLWEPSPRMMVRWTRIIKGYGADGERFIVDADMYGTTVSMSARISGEADVSPLGDSPHADVTIGFWCADPRMYGPAETIPAASSILILNKGNFPATPRLRVTGNAPGWTATGPHGKRIVCTVPIEPGDVHEYDLAEARLYVNGERRHRSTSLAQLWAIPAEHEVSVSVSTGCLIGATRRDVYV